VSPPTDRPKADLQQAQDELRKAIESGRELVRQSRVLLELSECASAVPANDNDRRFID
jgi:hypothetical protein